MSDMQSLSLASLLLLCAALLAGLAATVRALARHDGRPRRRLLAAGIAIGGAGALSSLALPGVIGGLGSLLAVALLVGLDLFELGQAGLLSAYAWPATGYLTAAAQARQAGDPARAASEYGRAVLALRKGRRRSRELDAEVRRGACLVSAGQGEIAEAAALESVARARLAGDPDLIWRSLVGAGDVEAELGEAAAAKRDYQEAVQVARDSGSWLGVAFACGQLGWLEYDAGDYDLALGYLRWAGYAANAILSPGLISGLSLLAGMLALTESKLVPARAALEDSAKTAAEAHDQDRLGLVGLALACLAYLEGWHDTAVGVVDQCIDALGRTNAPKRAVRWVVALSVVAHAKERVADAKEFAGHAQALVRPNDPLARLIAFCADPASAPELADQALEAARLFGGVEAASAARGATAAGAG